MSFIVYSMDGCKHCELVKDLMVLANQTHVVYTLDQHFTIEEFEATFNTKYFPQVVNQSHQYQHDHHLHQFLLLEVLIFQD